MECFALKSNFSHEKLYSSFIILNFLLLVQTHVKLRNSKFFQVYVQISEMHII